jgi:predicted ATP-dependent endonuclease of OLD family
MHIKEIRINNFRSIKQIQIPMTNRKTILVGPNESGKSNILKAISFINISINPHIDDIRDRLPEDEDSDSNVKFIIEFDSSDIDEIINEIKSKILFLDDSFILKNEMPITLKEFCSSNNQLLYTINIDTQQKSYKYWTYNKDYSINENLKSLVNIQPNETILLNNESIRLADRSFIYIKDFDTIRKETLSATTFEEVGKLYFKLKEKKFEENFPQSIIWKYNNEDTLPSRIDFNTFINNPGMNTTLKHMFELAGISKIGKELKDAQKKQNGINNLFRLVGEKTTKYLHQIWPNTAKLKIILNQNGNNIEIGIEDAFNVYDFSRRSDGFKRFISFILSISASHRSNNLSNAFIIIDEPDIGLHPESSKQLYKELDLLSKENFVIYSTHSIFMIDQEKLDNHLLVEKQNEITSIKSLDAGNITDTELIYNSLGYSIFEHLSKKNIIFEGWRDSRLFKIALSKNIFSEYAELFKDCGITYAFGVKDIPRIVTFLELAGREYVIISDSDIPALEAREKFPDKDKWKTYKDIFTEQSIITSEDLISSTKNLMTINEIFEVNGMTPLVVLSDNGNVMKEIDSYLSKNSVEKSKKKEVLDLFKERVYNTLTPEEVNDSYLDLLKFLKETMYKNE